MAVRKPATTAEILDVLYRAKRGRLKEEQFRALGWTDAVETLRRDLRTTNTKAGEWLVAALSEPGIPIAAVRPFVGSFVGADAPAGSLSQLGWTDAEIHDFQFTSWGSLLIPGAKVPEQARQAQAYIVKIEHLTAMRALLAQARAEVTAKREAKRVAELAAFRALHGDALDMIQAVMDRVPGEKYLRDDLINPRMHEGSGQFFGDDAILSITLRGNQIDAFATALLVMPELRSTEGSVTDG